MERREEAGGEVKNAKERPGWRGLENRTGTNRVEEGGAARFNRPYLAAKH